MAEITALDVLDYARIYLNDATGNQWNNETLLPYLKLAWDELSVELQSRDIMVMNESSAVIPVNIGTDVILPPEDMITPFHIMERPRGGSDSDFAMMTPVSWESISDAANTNLGYWTWRDGQIYFPKHTADVDIYIHYLKGLFELEDENTPIQISNCRVVLAKRCAALAARYGNSNPTRADLLDMEAMYFIQKITSIEIKTKQNTHRVRRRGYGRNRRSVMV
jgi:hypothetical protein